jgi:hypothetical protein
MLNDFELTDEQQKRSVRGIRVTEVEEIFRRSI